MRTTKATVDYDSDNDQLAIEREESSVASTIEMGDIIFEFDSNGIVCGMEFLDATSLLSSLYPDLKGEIDLAHIDEASLSQRQSGNNIIIYFTLVSKTGKIEKSFPLPLIASAE